MSDTLNKTLKGGEFLIKEIPANEIFSLEELSEEQKMLRDSAKEFIDREVVPQHDRFEKKRLRVDRRNNAQIRRNGTSWNYRS